MITRGTKVLIDARVGGVLPRTAPGKVDVIYEPGAVGTCLRGITIGGEPDWYVLSVGPHEVTLHRSQFTLL